MDSASGYSDDGDTTDSGDWSYSETCCFGFDDSIKEYHIHYYGGNLDYLNKVYRENTGRKSLLADLAEHLQQKWGDLLKTVDVDYDRGEGEAYLWFHVENRHLPQDKKEKHKKISDIVKELKDFFDTEVQRSVFPKLLRIVMRRLEWSKYMANALCEYQAKHGKEATQTAIHLLFDTLRHRVRF